MASVSSIPSYAPTTGITQVSADSKKQFEHTHPSAAPFDGMQHAACAISHRMVKASVACCLTGTFRRKPVVYERNNCRIVLKARVGILAVKDFNNKVKHTY